METEILVAVISGAFAIFSALVAGINAFKTKQAQHRHEKQLKELRLEHDKEMESERIANSEKVDMSSLVVKAQEGVSKAFETQFTQAQTQYENLLNEFKTFKEESKKDRQHHEKVTKNYERQVRNFRKILSTIKFNLLLMGSRIDDIYGSLNDENMELVLKVQKLSSIYEAVITSLESVDVVKNVPEGMLVHFDIKPIAAVEDPDEHKDS